MLVTFASLNTAHPTHAQEIPPNPDRLTFKPLAYTPPSAKDYRVVLKNGMVAYVAEDKALPLVNIAITVRTGSYLEPAGKEGLAGFTGAQMRRGGTARLSAEQLDERFDFLAAQASTGIGPTSGSASLNCLADNLDESLKLFVEVLRSPRFQEDRLALAKEQALQEMKKRNDDSADIESREWNVLLGGEAHFTNRFTTEVSVKAITREDMASFHRRFFHPANFIAAVSASIPRAEMVRRLEAAFANWPSPRAVVPLPPDTISPAPPGLYRIQKEVNQGRVSMGLPTVKRDSPDQYALEVMNEILGGSGFTSRITKTVRSNEGLAYSAGSGLSATRLVQDEIKKMREGTVTAEELETIQNNLIQTFPSNFASKAQSMGIFASDEYTRRDPSYWATYRDRIKAVTPADVQRVARTWLVPEKMVVLVVGDQREMDLGDPKHDVKLASLAPGGKVVNLPLRDPMTMLPGR